MKKLDVKECEYECRGAEMFKPDEWVVSLDFARTLETQRDEARAELAAARKDVDKTNEITIEVMRERDEARAEVERLRKALGEVQEKWRLFLEPAKQLKSCGGQTLGSESYRLEFIGNALAIVEDAFAEALDIAPTVITNHPSPEIFEAHGREWYAHDGNKNCPCVGLDKVDLLYKPPGREVSKNVPVKEVIWKNEGFPKVLHIVGWRPADAPEKLPRK